ncbi:MAG: GTP cyclohydrolase II [Rickettsiales bacterium]|nr:GTP cyclohydrolase II [Rickettsiales bacterium]
MLSSDPYLAFERASDELRRQMGIAVEHNGQATLYYPTEFLSEAQWQAFRTSVTSPALILTTARAKSLGLAAQHHAPIAIDAIGLSLAQLQHLADPLAGVITLPDLSVTAASAPAQQALQLAKQASVLPALVTGSAITIPADWQRISLQDLQHALTHPVIDVVQTASAALPLTIAEQTRITSFRLRHSNVVHLALIIGTPTDTPLVRVHSSCVTGDILGSLRCDCGGQLQQALAEIAKAGSGVLLYLHQEGRNIGITNKIRAYALQEKGIDTYDANRLLGFEEDERDFSIAAALLKKLGITQVKLLTNNPEKLAMLEQAGIKVVERIPLVTEATAHNHHYLQTKEKKAGHLF